MLKQKGIPQPIIDHALEQISDDQFFMMATKVANKKKSLLKEKDSWRLKQKIYAYLFQKGFQSTTISRVLDSIN